MAKFEELLESYYEDTVELIDGKLLSFRRVFDYHCTNRTAIEVSIEDTENQTLTKISTYFDGKWVFSTPVHENLFWTHIKPNYEKVRAIINPREISPISEPSPALVKFNAATRSFAKIFEIFKGV
jgi:hypothetical protein